ncbi:MAG: RNA polymerase sigma factor region1.1 domain-containing protein, partial [bacterium]|nr:RNA polymerase sigma factor region1.1 domain-containing protein [bacterium]
MKQKSSTPIKSGSSMLLEIVASAKKRGYITQDEILAIFPKPEEHIADLDELYNKFLRSNIDVFESVAQN